MHTFDFSVPGRLGLAQAFVDRGERGLPEVWVGDLTPTTCELCGARPAPYLARMIVVDAHRGDLVASTFRICVDCYADARREGTLLAGVLAHSEK